MSSRGEELVGGSTILLMHRSGQGLIQCCGCCGSCVPGHGFQGVIVMMVGLFQPGSLAIKDFQYRQGLHFRRQLTRHPQSGHQGHKCMKADVVFPAERASICQCRRRDQLLQGCALTQFCNNGRQEFLNRGLLKQINKAIVTGETQSLRWRFSWRGRKAQLGCGGVSQSGGQHALTDTSKKCATWSHDEPDPSAENVETITVSVQLSVVQVEAKLTQNRCCRHSEVHSESGKDRSFVRRCGHRRG